MKLVLLSGGSGRRLWPLSNDSRSKQFLKVLENGQKRQSMVQRVWNQLNEVNISHSTFIATSKSQIEMIHSQIGENVPIIVEPQRRDTFPAIALAATYLYSQKGIGLQEVVGVLPVDPFVDTSFFNKVLEMEKVLINKEADLALVGVIPTFPSSKYGYIVPKVIMQDHLEVSHFKEKPTEDIANQLIDQSALWNCGVFAFKLNYIISMLKERGFPIQYEELAKQYDNLPRISFDYEVVEKAKKIVALPYDGFWKDLGTWNTLTDEMASNQIGKGVISEDSSNTHLINELDIPVNVLGISNAVVVASPDGILVSDKSASPRVKELLKGQENRPMYEERLWGSYKILDFTKYKDGQEVLTRKVVLGEGKNISYHKHLKRQEVWTILKGKGLLVLNDEITSLKTGDVITIPIGAEHAIKALSDLEFIEVQTGSELIEEDIERKFMTWNEIEEYLGGFSK